jgi:ribosomal protein L24
MTQKKKLVIGSKVILIRGPKDIRKSKKVFEIQSIKGNYLELKDYVRKKTQKITEENNENFKYVMIPIHISAVKAFDSLAGQASRVGFKREADGTLVRYFKKTSNILMPELKKESN